nr:MAG TPA: hypothetical protein [Bacteriophage sp.]
MMILACMLFCFGYYRALVSGDWSGGGSCSPRWVDGAHVGILYPNCAARAASDMWASEPTHS